MPANTCKSLSVIALAMALCACGGGGSSRSSSAPAPAISDAQVRQVMDRATAAQPRPGSIVQSSNVSAGVTADTVDINPRGSGGAMTFTKTGGSGGRSMEITSGDSRNIYEETLAIPGETGASTINMGRNLGTLANGNSLIGGVFMYETHDETKYSSLDQDTDYTAAGFWAVLEVDSDDNIAGLPELGVFVDGNDYTGALPTTDISATFSGFAAGFYYRAGHSLFDALYDDDSDDNGQFNADASITVNFLASGLHTASAAISNIDIGKGTPDPSEPGLDITLGGATWDASQHIFLGDTIGCIFGTRTCHATSATASWGARFFGAADSDKIPEILAGTFGASDIQITIDGQTETLGSILGIFSTKRDNPAP